MSHAVLNPNTLTDDPLPHPFCCYHRRTAEGTLCLGSLRESLVESARQKDWTDYGRLSCLIWGLEHSPYIGLDGLED